VNFDEFFTTLSDFYSTSIPNDSPRWIILSNNKWKIYWDLYITFTLFFLCIAVPIRLAFTSEDPPEWVVVYAVTDISFLVDIVLTFYTSFEDEVSNQEVIDHKSIVKNYLKGWFWFDVLSIIPADYMLASDQSNAFSVNSLFRFAKFGKVYKIIRLVRLAKVFKLLKKNKSLISRLSEKLSLNSGVERLLLFFVFLLIFIHVFGCMFILLDDIELDPAAQDWIAVQNSKFNQEFDGFDLYIMSCYFTVTTMITVGYGDISATNTNERVYCVFLMLVGVCCFTFITGALSSILSNYDISQAVL
jgi:hypothetical protein